jgi:group I intron endonuclease
LIIPWICNVIGEYMAVIYRITNMANNKFYIGSALSFERRSWQHKYDLKRGVHKNPRLQAAWNKYGEEMFVFEVLEEIPAGEDQLAWENKYLHVHVGQPDCYNINTDAAGMRIGIPHTEESKRKTSASRKGKAAGEDHYRYGQEVAEEVRQKIGDTQRGKAKAPGRKVTEEGRAKIRANIEAGRSHKHWLGRKHTDESKAKMSRAIIAKRADGTEMHMLSITHLRLATGLKPATINRSLKSGRPIIKGKFAGWSFKYVDTIPAT